MITILVVDDETNIADGVAATLRTGLDIDADIHVCYGAQSAKEYAAEHYIDLIVCDINMPKQNGLSLCRELLAKYPDLKIIFLTGYSDFSYTYEAMKLPDVSYVLKLEDDDVLLATVRKKLRAQAEERHRRAELMRERQRSDRLAAQLSDLRFEKAVTLDGDMAYCGFVFLLMQFASPVRGVRPFLEGAFPGKVCAVELDSRLKPILDLTVGEFSNLEILWEDVLKLDIPALVKEKFPGLRPMACANLPYYITSPILTALLEADCFDSVTVMVQKEVAQRIAAAPGSADYGAFSVFCQYYAQPELLFDVPAHCFLPQPKVTSAVISLKTYRERPWKVEKEKTFFRLVRASFAMRRKKLSNGLASGFPELGKTGAAEVIAAAGFDANVRGETLGIPEFARLAAEIDRYGMQ